MKTNGLAAVVFGAVLGAAGYAAFSARAVDAQPGVMPTPPKVEPITPKKSTEPPPTTPRRIRQETREEPFQIDGSVIAGCGSSVFVATTVVGTLRIAKDGAVRPMRIQVSPPSDAIARCVRERLSTARFSSGNTSKEFVAEWRFEPTAAAPAQ